MKEHVEASKQNEIVPVQLTYPRVDQFKVEFIPFKPAILYRYCDHHAATSEEEKEYTDEVNAFLSALVNSEAFIDFFNSNNHAVTRNQLSIFIRSANLQVKEPDTSKYYCYEEEGYLVLNNSWLFDKRITPTYCFCYDGVSYELTGSQAAFPTHYMNKQKAECNNASEWYYTDDADGFGSLFCLACKYLIPAFYQFYKDTDGVDSYYLSEYGVYIEDCPGLSDAISLIKEKITKVSFCASEDTPNGCFNYTLLYTNYDEVRNLIRLNKTDLKRMSEGVYVPDAK